MMLAQTKYVMHNNTITIHTSTMARLKDRRMSYKTERNAAQRSRASPK